MSTKKFAPAAPIIPATWLPYMYCSFRQIHPSVLVTFTASAFLVGEGQRKSGETSLAMSTVITKGLKFLTSKNFERP